jgi:hypothetical protein
MIKFGILKSKIEKVLLESYSNNTIKDELKKFKTNVLDNKNVSKLFYLYDELNSNKGLSESVVSDYINECTTIYENTINKIKPSEFQKIKSWVGNVKTNNNYENVDNLFSTDVLTIESRLQSRKVISESLKKNKPLEKEVVNLPLSTMVNVANKTITTFMEGLNESEKKELLSLLSEDDSKLKDNFDNIKNDVIVKLENLKENSDESTLIRINETIQKVTSEKYDKLSYFKLKGLKDTL